MPSKREIIEELNFLSGLLSERVRTAAAVVLAFCWAFIVEGGAAPQGGFLSAREVMPPLLLAVLTLLADFGQYLAGLKLNVNTLRRIEAEGLEQLAYNAQDPFYRLRQALFRAKMALLALALGWLLALVIARIV